MRDGATGSPACRATDPCYAVAMADPQKLPGWRTGWTWTLIKCAVTTLFTAIAATGTLAWLIRKLLDELPGWLPDSWGRWAFEWLLSHLWFIGPIVGVVVGLILSTGIIVIDAMRGKLKRVP